MNSTTSRSPANRRAPESRASAACSRGLSQHIAPMTPKRQHQQRSRRDVVLLASAQEATVLVGDIGGTNARLSLWRAKGPRASSELFAKTYPTAGHSTFDDVMGVFLADCRTSGAAPSAAALAVAGAVEDNRCEMTNLSWVVDGPGLSGHYGFKVQVLNDFEAVGYGIPALEPEDMVQLTKNVPKPQAPKVVMGPGTGLGAAQLMWDEGLQDYKVWPGEGAHGTFAPRGYKQAALAAWAARRFDGHVEVEQVACGSGLELIYEFLISDDLAGNPLRGASKKTAAEITTAALGGTDPVAAEAVDMLMAIVGAEAGGMALRCIARGGIYIAGGITPRLLPRLRASSTGGGMLLEGVLGRNLRPKFRDFLATLPVAVITNEKVGQMGARAVAVKLLKRTRTPTPR